MDDRIIEELDNLDVKETEQLLSSVNASEFNKEINKKIRSRIEISVLHKAGITKTKAKKALIPRKRRLFVYALIMSLIELFFFTSSAFVAWMDGFLENSGINLSFYGIVPIILYIIMFGVLDLCIYKVMYHMDSEKFSVDIILPKSKTTITYTVYFIFSAVLKLFLIKFFVFFINTIIYLVSYKFEIFFMLLGYVISIAIFAAADMLLAKLKNLLILKFDGTNEIRFKWKLSLKSFWIEILKYFGILVYIVTLIMSNILITNKIVSFLIGFVLFFALNIFMTIIVQLRKRCCLRPIETAEEKALSENETKKFEEEASDRRSLLNRRVFILGLSASAAIYMFCLLIPYIVYPGLTPQKPLLESFSGIEQVDEFFLHSKLPFEIKSLTADVSDSTESFFMFNRMIVGAIINRPGMFSGEIVNKSENVQYTSPLTDGALNGGVDTIELTKRSSEYSTTNTQVERVDEADVIKTDGKHVYYLNGSKLFILKAYPPEQMKTIYKYDFLQENLYPLELFLYEDHIAVILTDDTDDELRKGNRNYSTNTVVRTYNINDPSNPTLERSFRLDYSYLTSRMIENYLYIVSTAYINYDGFKPSYIDSAIGDSKMEISYKDLFLVRGNVSDKYRQINVVAALPVDKPYSRAQVKAYIGGGGETVYVSTEHIYIVETTSNAITEASLGEFLYSLTDEEFIKLDFLKYGTSIYRIEIKDGNIGDFDSAFVTGMVHNQFSMDEYEGYFRITTQKGMWEYASSNVYVLDSDMNVCGSLEGLAPGETIYASRFMGDRLYLVTFKTVDPLFVISLKNPKKPTVLGKLKIPGYSEYLHLLDENHIIGFGKDTAGGNENFSYYQGIKMAIFDVSDVKNPKEKFVEIIGDRGTDSELLSNHKALMYMKNLELMAFPVTLCERREAGSDDDYGEFSFQGAFVYNVNSTDGFKLRGKITHIDSYDEIAYSNIYDYENASFINRIIYANDSLYTFSSDKVKATRYSDMKEISEIPLE